MSVPECLLPDVLAYLREPAPSDGDLRDIHGAWDAAAAYLSGAGVAEPERQDRRWPLWLQVMEALTLDSYDQRGAQFERGQLQENQAVRRMLNQLKFDGLPEE